MTKKICFIFLLISASISMCLMSNTYSRYVYDTTGNIDILFANWQILVNQNDITTSNSSAISFEPVIEANYNIKSNTVAPTSKGHFDIDIDPSNVEVSFNSTINLSIEHENIPDLMITKYSIIPKDYTEGDELEVINLEGTSITNTLDFDNTTENFSFKPFTVRVYFEWYEGENEQMNDESDTNAANSADSFKINANISFEQKA